jgi:hypothetical protein
MRKLGKKLIFGNGLTMAWSISPMKGMIASLLVVSLGGMGR